MPARACISGGAWVRSLPSKTMRPVVGWVSPARQLKKVDLPAPFGPISPMISPCSTVRSAPATARKPPNSLETLVASSNRGAPPAFRHDSIPQIEQAARLKTRDNHDDAAINNVGEAGPAAAEPAIGRGLQRHQDHRAEEWAEQQPGTAERGNDHHLHGDQNAEAGIRIDKAGLHDIERTSDGRERSA